MSRGILPARALTQLLALCGALLAGKALGSAISGPSSSTTGSFSLTWPAGYELRLQDASWRFAAPNTTSHDFVDLPSGTYNFLLTQCFYIPPPYGPGWSCVDETTSVKTVTVTRDAEPPIDTTTSEAGTLAYTASTSSRGSGQVAVPLRTIPGVNSHAPQLSMVYDSARGSDINEVEFLEDELGYGWHLQGLSRIQRCRSGLSGTGSPALTSTDTLCIDGQFLKVVSGSYWADGSVYRTESQSHVQVTKMPGDWFEVRFPDGRIARYGDTATSRVIGSGQFTGVYMWAQPSPTVVWAERHVTNPLGDVYTVDYEVNDPYGLIQPKTITYSGATVEFKYGPRSDTAPVYFFLPGGFSYVKRPSVLHTVRVKMHGVPVREYRLDSNLVAGRMQLEHIQECGYSESGSGPACLRPLVIGWSAVSGGTQNFPIAVSSLTDGLGARTEYIYAAVDTTANPLTYSEAPFGALPASPSTIVAQPVAVVSEMRRSDGISAGAANRWTYRYKSYAYQDSLNRGYLGFHETRTRDEQTGIHAYTQHRIDGIFRGSPSQVRVFTNLFGSGGNELERREIAYTAHAITGGLVLPLASRITTWRLEGAVVVSGSEREVSYCFRALSGDTCPSTGTEFEHPTQMISTTTAGDFVSDDAYTPLFWGDVPDRVISGVKQTSVSSVSLLNSTSPWIKQLPIRQTVIETAAGKPSKTVVNRNVFLANTAILASRTLRDNDAPTRLTWTRTFSGNNPVQDCLDGSTFTCIATNYAAAYVDDRYPPSVSNALNQVTSLAWDPRFGTPTTVTDPDNNQTKTEYDSFGRVVRVVAVDGTTTDTTYEGCDSVSCADVIGAQAAMKISTSVTNGGLQVSPGSARYVDVLGRVVLAEVEALDALDGMRMVRTVYDVQGRVRYVSRPYFSSQTMPDCAATGLNCTGYAYDIRNRVTREVRPDGGLITRSYTGSVGASSVVTTQTVRRPLNTDVTQSRQDTFNSLGQLIYTGDAAGTSLTVPANYYYDSHGNLETVYVGGQIVATMTYDLAGNRTQLVEPNTGTNTYQFDARQLLTQSTDALGQQTRYTYDLLGRLIQRQDRYGLGTQVNNVWDWDAYAATGRLESVTNGPYTETYGYQATDGKLSSIDTSINVPGVLTKNYNRAFGYDGAGRLSTIAYPNLTITRTYAAHGHLTGFKKGSTVLDEVADTDAWGNATEQRFQNSTLRTSRTFEQASGRLLTLSSGTSAAPKSIQDLEYLWQSNSALLMRKDLRNTSSSGDDYRDVYDYDDLNRLYRQQTDTGASRQLDFTFDIHGNLTNKLSNAASDLDVTGYTYGAAAKPHRLTSVNIGGTINTLSYLATGETYRYDAATGDDTWLEYDGQRNVTKITVGTSQTTAAPKARDEFWYTPNGDRFLGRETWNVSGTQRSAITTYLGDFEETRPASNSSYSLFRRVRVTPNVQWTWRQVPAGGTSSFFRFLHRDHLGSLDVITSNKGAVINKTSFDPFGGRRGKTWNSDIPLADLNALLSVHYEDENSPRGFTDHEHLSRTGFIHMNGRVHDPRIGRFVSPDPIVQSPTFSQSYNRYAYTFNNPLSLTDPSGFCSGAHTNNEVVLTCPNLAPHFEPPPGWGPTIPWPALDFRIPSDWYQNHYDGCSGQPCPGPTEEATGTGNDCAGAACSEEIQVIARRVSSFSVKLSFHAVVPGLFYHLALEGSNADRSEAETFSAGNHLYFTPVLLSQFKRRTDTPSTNTVLMDVLPPDGMSGRDYWKVIGIHDSFYKDNVRYRPFPSGTSYNSGSYAVGLVYATGGKLTQGIDPFFFPGTDHPLPPSYFLP